MVACSNANEIFAYAALNHGADPDVIQEAVAQYRRLGGSLWRFAGKRANGARASLRCIGIVGALGASSIQRLGGHGAKISKVVPTAGDLHASAFLH